MPATIIGDLPLRLIHDLIVRSRRLHWSVPAARVRGHVLERSIDEIEETFAEWRWEDGSIPSYRYEGEDLNLRRPAHRYRFSDSGEWFWMQDHARFFELADGRVFANCHHEASPIPHPSKHYHEVGFSWTRGFAHLEEFLEARRWGRERVHFDAVDVA